MKRHFKPKIKQNPFLWLTPLLLTVAGIAVIALNLFLFRMPEWITVLISAAILAAAVIMWVKLKNKKAAKVIISLVSLLGIAFSLFGSYCNPYWNSIAFYFGADWYCE